MGELALAGCDSQVNEKRNLNKRGKCGSMRKEVDLVEMERK